MGREPEKKLKRSKSKKSMSCDSVKCHRIHYDSTERCTRYHCNDEGFCKVASDADPRIKKHVTTMLKASYCNFIRDEILACLLVLFGGFCIGAMMPGLVPTGGPTMEDLLENFLNELPNKVFWDHDDNSRFYASEACIENQGDKLVWTSTSEKQKEDEEIIIREPENEPPHYISDKCITINGKMYCPESTEKEDAQNDESDDQLMELMYEYLIKTGRTKSLLKMLKHADEQ